MNVPQLARRAACICLAAWLALLVASPARAGEKNCEVTLATTKVDFGRLSRATLAAGSDGRYHLPARSTGLHVRCVEPQDMTVFFLGPVTDADGFRFADHSRFALHLRDARLDGERVALGEVERGGSFPSGIAARLAWTPALGLMPVKGGRAASGREFSAQIDIDVQVDERDLTVGDATRWVANGTIEAMNGFPRALTLQANVQAGRCHVDAVRHVSFGRVRSTDLNARGASTHVPSTRSGQLRVICDGAMPLALRVARDERAGTAVPPVGLDASFEHGELFGLGTTQAGENIGAYVLRWGTSATSDQGELHIARSLDGGRHWDAVGGAVLANHTSGERVGYTPIRDGPAGPLAVRTLDVTLDATVYIAPKSSLSLGEEIAADGLATFEIIY